MTPIYRQVTGVFLFVCVFVLASAGQAQTTSTMQSEPWMKRLNDSPRHHEWAEVKNGERTVHAFVVFPEVSEKATAVVLIHENTGLTDWVRGVADRVAEAGFIAIAPDFLSGMAPGGGKTADFPDRNAARDAIGRLNGMPEQVTGDLNAVVDFISKHEAANGKVAVAGFCWGGAQTFNYAAKNPDIKGAFVFYGGAPRDEEELKKIQAPVYGFYGENDARITSAVPDVEKKMKDAGKTFEQVTYAGAGHGFMRAGETAEPDSANAKAKDEGWTRFIELLKKM